MRLAKHLSFVLLLACPALAVAQERNQQVAPTGGSYTGLYRGEYQYPDGTNQAPVKFEIVLIQEGDTVAGFMREPNTFGQRKAPYLTAAFKGKIENGKLSITKTYDGTAGPSHDVQYNGDFGDDGKKIEGRWAIGDFSGTFALHKVAKSGPGPMSGVWNGRYEYPQDANKGPVDFKVLIVQEGDGVVGFMKEPNTFGKRGEEPYLHALLKGRLDRQSGKLTFTKTYDGTEDIDHNVEYSGEGNGDRSSFSGSWSLADGFSGRFTLSRQRLDDRTLENLK